MFEKQMALLLQKVNFAIAFAMFAIYLATIPNKDMHVTSGYIKLKSVTALAALLLMQILSMCHTKISNQLFDDVKRYSEDVDRSASEKEVFFACMSHEIRNPIQSLQGALELLLPTVQGAGDPETAKLSEIAKNGCEMVLNLVANILDISKIHAGKMELCVMPANLRETILKVLRLTRPKAEGKGLYLRFEDCSQLPPVLQIDAHKLSQVILNIVSNAVKFTQRGGITIGLSWVPDPVAMRRDRSSLSVMPTIREGWETSSECEAVSHNRIYTRYSRDYQGTRSPVKFSNDEPVRTTVASPLTLGTTPTRRISSGERGGTVKISIADTGIGIRSENLEKLFTAFNQADSSISS